MDDYSDLVEEISESERILRKQDKEIARLKSIANNNQEEVSLRRKYQILGDRKKLEKKLKNNRIKIKDYKFQLSEIEKKIELQKNQIESLCNENDKLKIKIRKNSDNNRSPKKKIKGVSDLRKSFGFILKERLKQYENKKEEEDDDISPGFSKEQKEAEFEQLKKLKTESETTFYKLKEYIINYYKKADEQIIYVTNFRNYVNSLNNQIRSFRQQLRISVIGEDQLNFGNMPENIISQLTKDMETISNLINQVNEYIFYIKNRTLKKGENILRNIQAKLKEINNNKNLTLRFLSYRMDFIENQLDDLKKLCQRLKSSFTDIYNKKKDIEKNIDYLKRNVEKYMNNYKEGKKKINDAIRKTLRKTGKNIFSSINKNLRNEKSDENDEKNDEICDNIVEDENEDIDDELIRGSTLIKINDFGKNIDLFKSIVLFSDKNEKEENRTRSAKILRKNWHEVCYIYDDYDIHDINFEIKAVGLGPFSFFNSCSNGFYMGKEIDIIDFEINGKKSKYIYNNYCLEYNITLRNLEKAKIHLKYKERPKFDSMPQSEKSHYKFFRQEFYGLSESLEGQMGKYRIILKGSFEIVGFNDDFFIKNEKNTKEKEYIWGGKVPIGGKRTIVKLSKNQATWSIYCNTQIISRRGNLNNTILGVPMGFVGGNNDIIKLDYSSPQTKDISVDEEKRIYEIKYKNTRYTNGDFVLTGEIRNRCKGEWDVDLSDETIEENIPIEDKRDKKTLEKIARNIISEFDRANKNNIFNFMDYAKIGKWINKNVKYDLNYCGRTEMTAMDIYRQKVGVCHHMTRLANALLYSLGYKVIYVNGFACENSSDFDHNCAHAWSLINVNGKWYPFDATWNILTGKLPVCHVFQGFFGKSTTLVGSDGAYFGKNSKEIGKFIK